MQVIDNQGRVLIKRELSNNEQSLKLDISNLIGGVYYLQLSNTEGRVVNKKFVKE
jgi:hypothetical protein